MYLNYKWNEDGLHIKRVPANKVLTPILYYVLRPYNSKRKGKRWHKDYELGLLLFEAASHLFLLAVIFDVLFLKDFLWNMQGWIGFIYRYSVPILGCAYMIADEIIKYSRKQS